MSPGTRKRIKRIRRLGSPELVSAFEKGLLSAGAAENLLHLSPADQVAELQRRQALVERREHKAKVAAQIIGGYVDSHQERPIDMDELRRLLTARV